MKFYQDQYILQLVFVWNNKQIIEAMVSLTFSGLFSTTKRGIPDLSQLQSSTSISLSYFICSAILQGIIFLYLVAHFIVAVNRVTMKIKNKAFQDIPLQKKPSNKRKRKEQKRNNKQVFPEKVDKKLYQFDDFDEQQVETPQQPEQEVDQEEIQHKNQEKIEQKDDFASYHDENQQSFIKLDKKLLHFQPFIISFVICNNSFTLDIISSSLIVLTIASFLTFNIKRKLKTKKILPSLYIILSTLGFFSFLFNKPSLL